ncbi:hypothetical protein ASC80_01615 [Afipia sp. Root123D2]|uniref:hypothetical protein n=1 Tax=Afipia sp. Root123D2 TaxID=1736436 RepID=UPI0007007C76|nr:hypothetical protein [Afipia sp. Root123D2]KQW22120.1 hypothetical protein ASC80_01615 [Afipia sp. Root123D2]
MASGDNLLQRAKRVGLSQAEISRQAKLDKQTVQQIGRDRPMGPLQRTVERVRQVVVEREIETALHLLELPHVRQAVAERDDRRGEAA